MATRASSLLCGSLFLCALALTGCGDDDAMGSGDGGGMMIARDCGSTPRMDVGKCSLVAGGECRGELDPATFQFEPLSAGSRMTMVIGPQGSTMLVFLVRADGIDPGDTSVDTSATHPFVQVGVFAADTGEQLTVFRQRTGFTGSSAPYTSRQLWVVVDALASSLRDRSITAVASLTDRNGVARCGIANVVPQ